MLLKLPSKRSLCFLLSFLLVVSLFFVYPNSGQVIHANEGERTGDQFLYITEIMYDAPGSDTGNEYIEISNTGDEDLDISGYHIGDAATRGSNEGMFLFPEGTIIEAGQSLVIAQSALISRERYIVEDFEFEPDFELPRHATYNPQEDPNVPTLIKSDWATGYIVLAQVGDDVLLMDREQQVVDYVPYIIDRELNGETYKAAPGMTQHIQSLQRVFTTGDPSIDFHPLYATPGSYDLWEDEPHPFAGPVISDTLIITEVQYDAAYDEDIGEFIEFTNISDEPIDISGFNIGDSEFPNKPSDGEGMFTFPEGTIVEPYQPVLVARNALGVKNEFGVTPDFEFEESMDEVPSLERNTDWTHGMVKLANAADQALIYDQNMQIIDAVVWKTAAPFPGVDPHPGSYNNGNSLERVNEIDTNDCAVDFVDQPLPSPGVLLFGPNGDESRIPDTALRDDVLMPAEPESGLVLPPTAVGNGGDASNAPENTAAAFEKLLEMDVSQIVLPVQETADNKLIVMKDGTLDRTTDGTGRVDENLWSDIQELDAGSWFDPSFAGEKVPLLSEALNIVKGKLIPVIRVETPASVANVVELLEDEGVTDAHIISSDPQVVAAAREQNRELRGGIIYEETSYNREQLNDMLFTARRSGASIVLLKEEAITEAVVHYLRLRELGVWGIDFDDEQEAHNLIASGVIGLVSENPSAVISALGEYPEGSIVTRPTVVGHRGVTSGEQPENTMLAFEQAWQDGADMIEIDIQETKDGHLIVIHDFDLDRTTDGTGKVKDFTLSEIRQLNANYVDPSNPTPVPTLEEVFVWAKEKQQTRPILLTLEIKGKGLEQRMIDLVEQYDLKEDVVVACFHLEELREFRQLDPEFAFVWTYRGPDDVSDNAAAHAEKKVRTSIKEDLHLNPFGALYPELADFARHRGMLLRVGGVEEESDLRPVLVDGYPIVVTGDPDLFSAIPDRLSAPSDIKMYEDEAKALDATVHYQARDDEHIRPFVTLIWPDSDVIEIGQDKTTLNALASGEAFVQAYSQPTFAGEQWHLFARPTQVNVVEVSAAAMLRTLASFQDDFTNHGAYRSLEVHLTSVERFEKQQQADKIVKHMNSFIKLLEYHKDKQLMSEAAYNYLSDDAEALLSKWQ